MDRTSASGWWSALLVVATIGTAGCKDKAQPKFTECLEAEAQGHFALAESICDSARTIDPESKAGRAANEKMKELRPKADKERADRAVAAAQQAEAACHSHKFVSFCTSDGVPTGGMFGAWTQAGCQQDANGFAKMGLSCAPCRCADEVGGSAVSTRVRGNRPASVPAEIP